jgi:hypothetical protein
LPDEEQRQFSVSEEQRLLYCASDFVYNSLFYPPKWRT